MKARVLSVYDEGSVPGTPLIGARGFSVLVDVDGERTLFDTGRRGPYLMHNLDHLEIDVGTVDRIVISHPHSGHNGGLPSFLERRDEKIEVIVTPDGEHTPGSKFFGLTVRKPRPSDEKAEMRIMNEWTQLSENLFISGCIAGNENSLVITTKNGPALICGCCHCGIDALLPAAEQKLGEKISAVIGGIHLIGRKKNDIYGIAEVLKHRSLHLGHCTGQTQKTHLREILGLKAVGDLYAGTEILFDV